MRSLRPASAEVPWTVSFHSRATVLLFLLLSTMFELAAHATSFYVSPSGKDENDGSRSRPFATLQRAVDATRAIPPSKERRIILRGGEYFGVAVSLGPQDSGLVIEAARGEEPILFGGRLLTGFRPEGASLLAADLPKDTSSTPDFRMLWVNGRMASRARFPETGRITHLSEWKVPWMGTYGGGWQRKPTHEDLTTLRLKPGSAGTQFDPLNAEITIYHEWDESLVSVQSWDAALGTIRFNQESGHPPGAFGQQTCVIWNTLDGMTKPGQWLLDRRNCKVVYWPRNGETSSNLRVVYPTTEAIFRIVGSSAQPVRKVVIKGLTFSVANTPLKTGGFGAFAFDGAITAKHVEDCQFTGLLVHQVAGQGLKLSHAFRGEVSASEIRDTGAGGILCEDGTGLHVTRNFVHDIGRLYPSAIGITCSGLTNRVDGNRLQNTPYVGLTCDGDGARIENNRFQRVMQELHDGAAIYLGGTNHIVRGNHCRDIGNSTTDRRHAYYLDEMVRNTIVEGNLAVNCPVPLHNHIASDNRIIGNVFIHDGEMRLAFYRCDRHELDRNLVVANGKIEVYRPEAVTHWNKNLFFSRSGEILGYPVERYSAGSPQPLRLPGVELGPDPRVKEVAEGTIVWPKDSPATRLGISQLDVRSAGRDAGCPVIKGRKQVTRPSGFEAVK